MQEIVARAFAWGIAGMLIGPALVYSLMLVVLYSDPGCRSGSGACQLDVAINLTVGVVVGFVLFFVVTLIRGIHRRGREDET